MPIAVGGIGGFGCPIPCACGGACAAVPAIGGGGAAAIPGPFNGTIPGAFNAG